jgi:hypothetical protein
MLMGLVDGHQRAQQGNTNMLIYKALSAVAASAVGAAVVLALPGFSPEVEARTPPPVVKADRLDIRPAVADCSQQAWPYYEANCLRDRTQPQGQARPVRIVTTDRIAR